MVKLYFDAHNSIDSKLQLALQNIKHYSCGTQGNIRDYIWWDEGKQIANLIRLLKSYTLATGKLNTKIFSFGLC